MACAITLVMTSCGDKNTQDKVNIRIENVKKIQRELFYLGFQFV